jgi:hypothetical protein
VRNLLIVSIFLTASSGAHISRPSPIQLPEQISVRFSPDAYAEFTVSNGGVRAVTAHVGRMASQRFSLDGCADLINVHFDTLQLIREDLRSEDAYDAFTLNFDFGSELERHYGHLPRAQLSYSGGKWSIAEVSRATGERSSLSSRLCANSNTT